MTRKGSRLTMEPGGLGRPESSPAPWTRGPWQPALPAVSWLAALGECKEHDPACQS